MFAAVACEPGRLRPRPDSGLVAGTRQHATVAGRAHPTPSASIAPRRRPRRPRPDARRRRRSHAGPRSGAPDRPLVSPRAAARHPIAVMIDDLSPARPQSGFNAASVVWQAPAEGGIPRYMLVFQENDPDRRRPGPQRALLLHRLGRRAAGGLRPRRRLAAGPRHAPRQGQRPARLQRRRVPLGRVASTGSDCRIRAAQPVHDRQPAPGIAKASRRQGRRRSSWPWTFAPDAAARLAPDRRPDRGRLPAPTRSATTTTGRRTPTSARSRARRSQIDAATGKRVAPKNVVVMLMQFGPLNDGHPTSTASRPRSSAAGRPGSRRTGHDPGHLAEGVADGPDPASSTRSGKPVVADRRPDVRPGDADGTKITLTAGKAPPPADRIAGRAAQPELSRRRRRSRGSPTSA